MKLSAFSLSISLVALGTAHPAYADDKAQAQAQAERLEKAMTFDEKIALVHGTWPVPFLGTPVPEGAIPAAGYVPGIPRLGIPALTETDASLGVTNPSNVRPGDVATALPSSLALAATFDPAMAYATGAMVGAEARAKGFNVLLTGGVNLARDPRGGRNFEYYGEDPWLSGVMAGESIRGAQSNKIIATIKHFAVNDSETNRNWSNSVISKSAMRESDLLAFEFAIERGQPLSVMCGYNLINGAYACGNDYLLNKVLKTDWGYKGFVMSDWGAVKSPQFAVMGLDQQSGQELDEAVWFDKPLKNAIESGEVPVSRLSDMVKRILYAQIASGAFASPPQKATIDYSAHADLARRAAESSIVLLKNREGLLPLADKASNILVIGDYVEKGVLSGDGSSNVTAQTDQPSASMSAEGLFAQYVREQYHPSSPLLAIRARAPKAKVLFDNGRSAIEAERKASQADLVIVFGNQWMTESLDATDMALPRGQDDMIARVTAANPNTIVVLQTGGPVTMPWLDKAGAIVEAWYSGQRGGDAIAAVLFGDVNPSGRLPMTFPLSLAQTPRPELPGIDLPEKVQFDVVYNEGADVGYRWFARTGEAPLFPFGYGLSYTRFRYDHLKVSGGKQLTVSFTVTNIGDRVGQDAPQVYLEDTPQGKTRRLIGFEKVSLKPGEVRTITLTADPRLLSDFKVDTSGWEQREGTYKVAVSHYAGDTALSGTAQLAGGHFRP